MNFWADPWNALTGVGTLVLAAATFGVIWQGRRQRRDTERQHRDRFKPICLLAPYNGVDAWNRRGALIETAAPAPDNPSCGTVAIRCALRNVGVGPALKLRLKFRFLNKNGWTSEPWELSPLGAGETYGNEASPLLVPFPLHGRFNQTDFVTLPGELWEIWLEYEDVFGRQFHSIHSKMSFNPDPTTFKWTDAELGGQRKAIMLPIPWLSYSEGPAP